MIFSTNKSNYDSLLTEQAHEYASFVNSNKPWEWKQFTNGYNITVSQKKAIKAEAIRRKLIPDVPYKEGTQYLDFKAANLVEKEDYLPEELWLESDYKQFKFLDSRIDGRRPDGYTWHHTEIPGKMELVPFGPHNSNYHKGGRSPGHWAHTTR